MAEHITTDITGLMEAGAPKLNVLSIVSLLVDDGGRYLDINVDDTPSA